MTAPGVGVRGGIRPPGIPSSAVTPRGFSSLSHERVTLWHRTASGDARGSSRRVCRGRIRLCQPQERGLLEEVPWARRRAVLLALTLAGWSGSVWQCQRCVPCPLPAQSSWVLPLWRWRSLDREPLDLARAALAPLSSGKGMVWHREQPRALAGLPFPSFPGGFLLLWTCWMGARGAGRDVSVSVDDLACRRVLAAMLRRLTCLLTWKMQLCW